MKIINYFIVLLFIGMSVGCYKDKGHYDYKEISSVIVTFSPSDYTTSSDSVLKFVYKQPLVDTLKGEISALAVRSKTGEEDLNSDDLEYFWVNISADKDTTYGPVLHYALPPKKTTKTRYNLVIRDPETTLKFYREVIVSTQVPYLNSWFLLHGNDGDMKIGTVEMGTEKTFITQDTYFEVNGVHRFQDATNLLYSTNCGPQGAERLAILTPDSVFSIAPFQMKVDRTYDFIIPLVTPRMKILKGVSSYTIQFAGLVNDSEKLLHSGKEFLHFYTKLDAADPRTAKYKVADCFVDNNGRYTIWDEKQKCFHYYNATDNSYYIGTEREDEELINLAKMVTIPDAQWDEGELSNKSVVRFSAADGNSTVAIMKNNTSGQLWAYNIDYGGKSRGVLKGDEGSGMSFNVTRFELTGVAIEKESPFATSVTFANQFFYAEDNKLFIYNYMTGDRQIIYETDDIGDEITLMRFASPYYYPFNGKDHYSRLLGVAVHKSDNTYELHNILLAKSGDVESSSVYGSFERIKQIIFTLQSWAY